VVALWPGDGLGVVALSNAGGVQLALECVKYRVAEDVLGLKRVDWLARFQQQEPARESKMPAPAASPLGASDEKQAESVTQSLAQYAGTYWHDAYGALTLGSWPASRGSVPAQAFADYSLVHPLVKQGPEGCLVAAWRRVWCDHLMLVPVGTAAGSVEVEGEPQELEQEGKEETEEAEAHEFSMWGDTIHPLGCGADISPFLVRSARRPAKVVFDVSGAEGEVGGVRGMGLWGVDGAPIGGRRGKGGVRERAEVWFEKVA